MVERRKQSTRLLDSALDYLTYTNKLTTTVLFANLMAKQVGVNRDTARLTLNAREEITVIPHFCYLNGKMSEDLVAVSEKVLQGDNLGISFGLQETFKETRWNVKKGLLHSNSQPIRHVIQHLAELSAIRLQSSTEVRTLQPEVEKNKLNLSNAEIMQYLVLSLPHLGVCALKAVWLFVKGVLLGLLKRVPMLAFASEELNLTDQNVFAIDAINSRRTRTGRKRTVLQKLALALKTGARTFYEPKRIKFRPPTKNSLRGVTDIRRLTYDTIQKITRYGEKNKQWLAKKQSLSPYTMEIYVQKQLKCIYGATQTLAVEAGFPFEEYFQHLLLAINAQVPRMVAEVALL